jgi:hypothetical protein
MQMIKFAIAILLFAFGFAYCQAQNSDAASQYVYVKLSVFLPPIERGDKLEDPLDSFLKNRGVGECDGGGEMMSKPDASGKSHPEYSGLDVELTDFDRGIVLLKSELVKLGAPKGTVLEYERNGVKHSDPIE